MSDVGSEIPLAKQKNKSIPRRAVGRLALALLTGAALVNWIPPIAAIETIETDLGQNSALWTIADIHKRQLKHVAKANGIKLEKNTDYVSPLQQIINAVDEFERLSGKKVYYDFFSNRPTELIAREILNRVPILRDIETLGFASLIKQHAEAKAHRNKPIHFQVADTIAYYSPESAYHFYLNAIFWENFEPLFRARTGISKRLEQATGLRVDFFRGKNEAQMIWLNDLPEDKKQTAIDFCKKELMGWYSRHFAPEKKSSFPAMLVDALGKNNANLGLSIDEVAIVLKYMSRHDLNTEEYIADLPERLPEILGRFRNFKDTFSIYGRNFRSLISNPLEELI